MRRELKVAAGAGAIILMLLSIGPAQALAGSNTVASDDIIDGQVKTTDLALSAVTSARVKDGSLTGADINEKSLDGPKVEYMVVRGNGTKVSGTGTSVRTAQGAYSITFPRAIPTCAATISPGSVPGGTGFSLSIAAIHASSGNTFSVIMYKYNAASLEDTDFRMTVVCP